MYKSTKYANGDELEAAIEKGVEAYDAVSKPLLYNLTADHYTQGDNAYVFEFDNGSIDLSEWETIEVAMNMDLTGLPTISPWRPFAMPHFVIDYNASDERFTVGFTQTQVDNTNYNIFANMLEIVTRSNEKYAILYYGIRCAVITTTGIGTNGRPAPNKCNLKIWGVKKKNA